MIKHKPARLIGLAALCVTAFALSGAVCVTDDSMLDVYNGTVRLRVIANSDSAFDQSVKLAVRDALITDSSGLLEGCATQADAVAAVGVSRDRLLSTARKTLAENGADYGADVYVCEETFPVRTYGSLTFPAGRYTTVRVELGKAAGKNWFCVLYPPLCLSLAVRTESDERDVMLRYGFSKAQLDALSGGETEVRFFAADLFDSLFSSSN